MPAISIIVPVYKVESYLEKCINSILSQSYSDFEIILIDDGSPDNCGKICDRYSENFSNITVIHQKNGGLSDARNSGIDWAIQNSNSKWLVFVDSDDYLHVDYLKKLYETVLREQCDICMCNFLQVNEDGLEIEGNRNFPEGVEESKEQFFKLLYSHWRTVVAWNKIYKKDLFLSIRYDVGKIHEDEYIIHKLIYNCNKIAYINESLYYYVSRKGSIVNTEKEVEHKLIYLDVNIQRYWYCKKRNLCTDKKVSSTEYMFYVQNLGKDIPKERKDEYIALKKAYRKVFLDAATNKNKYRVLFDFYPLYRLLKLKNRSLKFKRIANQ